MSVEQTLTEAPVQQAVKSSDGDTTGGTGNTGGYELDEDGQRVPHGMGQSKSSRRRRRKRKGKGPEGPGAETAGQNGMQSGDQGGGEAGGGQVISSAQASGGDAPPAQGNAGQGQAARQHGGQGRSFDRGQQGSGQQGGGQQGGGQPGGGQQGGQNQNAPGGTKRWKKKFRDRDRGQQNGGGQQNAGSGGGGFSQAPPQSNGGGGFRGPDTHQPGNGGGGFKRKGGFGGGGGGKQQRGRSGFVGPMDHSYRAANGNVFDTSPSTMDPYGNGGGGQSRPRSYSGDSQPIDYSQGRAVPIAPDAPTKIYFFIDDLFFTAKIQETARKLGVKVAFVKNEKEQIAALTAGEDDARPGLIVFDLNNANAKPLTLIPKLKAKLKKSTSIVGFLSHLQGDLKAKAVEAGCDTVMPRAAFSQNLPNLLRRYGIEDVEEPNYNQ